MLRPAQVVALLEREQIGDERLGLGGGHDFVTGGGRVVAGEGERVVGGLAADFARDEKEAVGGHAAVRVEHVGIVEIAVERGGVGETLRRRCSGRRRRGCCRGRSGPARCNRADRCGG